MKQSSKTLSLISNRLTVAAVFAGGCYGHVLPGAQQLYAGSGRGV